MKSANCVSSTDDGSSGRTWDGALLPVVGVDALLALRSELSVSSLEPGLLNPFPVGPLWALGFWGLGSPQSLDPRLELGLLKLSEPARFWREASWLALEGRAKDEVAERRRRIVLEVSFMIGDGFLKA